ncbi:MAG: hypothetical protein MAG431_02531 [Chloroflexi bacterium]|nr:hypothetical protein [Chloroflexota bacterium]
MKTVLHNLEITWWNAHMRLVDESIIVRTSLSSLRELWLHRKTFVRALRWSLLGFPLGIFLGALKYLGQ